MNTHGPWHVKEAQSKHETPFIVADGPDTPGIVPIARINDCYPYGKNADNARLISAAPDLLEALESLFENCEMIHRHWGEGSNQREADAAIAAAHAAVAKARGIK